MAQPNDHTSNDTISALKRRITSLVKENDDLRGAETSTRKTCVYHSPFSFICQFAHVDISLIIIASQMRGILS